MTIALKVVEAAICCNGFDDGDDVGGRAKVFNGRD